MNILGVTHGHDAAACLFKDGELVAFCKQERLDRIKNSRGSFKLDCITEVLDMADLTPSHVDAVGFGLGPMPANCYRPLSYRFRQIANSIKAKEKNYSLYSEAKKNGIQLEKLVDQAQVRKIFGFSDSCQILFSNHHYSHILAAYRYSDWTSDALFVSCDGVGDGVHHSAYLLEGGKLRCLFGGEGTIQNVAASMGMMYGISTQLLGFIRNRHEGKVTGLAAFGSPLVADDILQHYRVTENGIEADFANMTDLKHCLSKLCNRTSREDFSASVQTALERIVVKMLNTLVRKHRIKYLGLNGGVFANVKLNQRICEIEDIEEIFVFPPMSDEGLAVGNAIYAQAQIQGMNAVERSRLRSLYLGRTHPESEFERVAHKHNLFLNRPINTALFAATLIKQGLIGAIFTQGMEMGPRALGGRSIIASPVDSQINDSLNKRLDRSEFMPFAPVVRREDAQQVFVLPDSALYAAEFMTVTCDVNPKYRQMIAAAVHVDGTARPQTITREQNSLYYDTLTEFYRLTGIPCLINTSFNAHEEPIINTPIEAISSLINDRVDFLITDNFIITKSERVQEAITKLQLSVCMSG